MIELIEGLPDGVVGVVAVGEVNSDDYTNVANPAVERALAQHGKIRLLHVLDDRFTGYTADGMWDDAKLGLTHPRSWERIAVVTDHRRIRTLVKGAGWSIPGEMRLFSNAERAEAEAWVSEDLESGRYAWPPLSSTSDSPGVIDATEAQLPPSHRQGG